MPEQTTALPKEPLLAEAVRMLLEKQMSCRNLLGNIKGKANKIGPMKDMPENPVYPEQHDNDTVLQMVQRAHGQAVDMDNTARSILEHLNTLI